MARYTLNLPVQLKQDTETWAAQQVVSLNQFILWAVAEKVGALSQRLDDPAFPHIPCRRGASGRRRAVVRGTGLRVQTLVVAARTWDLTPAQLAAEYELPITQIEEALAFAAAHQGEIDAAQAADAAREAAAPATPTTAPGC